MTALSLFGSTARGDGRPDSDVDLLVDLEENRRITLFDLSEIKFFASDVLGRTADVAIRKSVRRGYRAGIEMDALRIF